MDRQQECARLATTLLGYKSRVDSVSGRVNWWKPDGQVEVWGELSFDPWENANDDLLILESFQKQAPAVYSDYKDCLYHETRGHGTHTVWNYRKGKFANAAIMWFNKQRPS